MKHMIRPLIIFFLLPLWGINPMAWAGLYSGEQIILTNGDKFGVFNSETFSFSERGVIQELHNKTIKRIHHY